MNHLSFLHFSFVTNRSKLDAASMLAENVSRQEVMQRADRLALPMSVCKRRKILFGFD